MQNEYLIHTYESSIRYLVFGRHGTSIRPAYLCWYPLTIYMSIMDRKLPHLLPFD